MFGKRLKELRESNGYSMDKLVELYNLKYDAKMNKSTLSRYENGIQDPIYTVVVNLANFFNVSVDYLSGSNSDDITASFSTKTLITMEKFEKLNDAGKEKADSYIIDLLDNPKYVADLDKIDTGYASIAADTGKNGRVKAPDIDTIIALNKDE